MNFKKLSLMLLMLSLSGHALMGAEEQNIDFISYDKPICGKSAGRWVKNTIENTPKYISAEFETALIHISQMDTDIVNKKADIAQKARHAGFFVGITAGILGYAKLFTNFSPRNRILSAIGTFATAAPLIYGASRSGFTYFSDIPRNTYLLDKYSRYLPKKYQEIPQTAQKKVFTHLYKTITKDEPAHHWTHNKRVQSVYQKISDAYRADN